MKKGICFLLATIMMLTLLCSCGKSEKNSADTYIAMTQEFVDKGDIGSALDILNKGFEATKDERIAVMMAELSVNKTNDNATEKQSSETFVGIWAEEAISWIDGGMLLDVTVEGNDMNIYLSYTQGAPESRVAECMHSVPMSEIKGNEISFSFEDDGWGNSGNVSLKLGERIIVCEISDIQETDLPVWGFFEGEIELIKNDNAYTAMQYTEEEYNELFDEEDTVEMTIEEMKSNCRILAWDPSDLSLSAKYSEVAAYDMGNNPDYINQRFVPCQMQTYFAVCPRCLGNGYINGQKCYNTGYNNKDKIENNIHYILQADADKAVVRPISIAAVMTDANGNNVYKAYTNYYERQEINIYDARQDKSIIITEETMFVPYLIYLGEADNVMQFSMFACDIIG